MWWIQTICLDLERLLPWWELMTLQLMSGMVLKVWVYWTLPVDMKLECLLLRWELRTLWLTSPTALEVA